MILGFSLFDCIIHTSIIFTYKFSYAFDIILIQNLLHMIVFVSSRITAVI